MIDLAMGNKNIVVSIIGISLIGYTMFNTLTKLETKKDEAHFQQLQEEVVITRFDEKVVEKIRDLDDFQESIDSEFANDRNNPFIENSDSGFSDQRENPLQVFDEPELSIDISGGSVADIDSTLAADIEIMAGALSIYYVSNGSFPASASQVTHENLKTYLPASDVRNYTDSNDQPVADGQDQRDGRYYYAVSPEGCIASECTNFRLSVTDPNSDIQYSRFSL